MNFTDDCYTIVGMGDSAIPSFRDHPTDNEKWPPPKMLKLQFCHMCREKGNMKKSSANCHLINDSKGGRAASVCVCNILELRAVSNNKIGSRRERRQQFPACFVKQPPHHQTAILNYGTTCPYEMSPLSTSCL